MSKIRFCIRQRLIAGRQTYQAGITLPLWSIIKVRGIGPLFDSFDDAQAYINQIRPRKS